MRRVEALRRVTMQDVRPDSPYATIPTDEIDRIVEMEMRGCFPSKIAEMLNLSISQVDSLKTRFPEYYERSRSNLIASVADRFKANMFRTYELVGAEAFTSVQVLKDIRDDPNVSPSCRKDAARAIIQFAGDLVADKVVKRSGAQHPAEIRALAEKAREVMEGSSLVRMLEQAVTEGQN